MPALLRGHVPADEEPGPGRQNSCRQADCQRVEVAGTGSRGALSRTLTKTPPGAKVQLNSDAEGGPVRMNTEFTLTQKRALAVVTLIAVLFGAYFLRDYFVLIVVAAVGAYLFTPLFNRFNRRLGTGLSATCTLLSALVIVIVPIGLLVVLAVVQISRMIDSIAGWVKTTDLSGLGDKVLHIVNGLLARVPFAHTTITAETLRKTMITVGRNAG